MKFARFAFAPLALLIACSSSSSQPAQDKGLTDDGVGAAASAPDTNPDGVPYPTDNIGTNPRSGSRSGDRIANYKFLGYVDGDVSKGLQPVSLANYFDPTGKRYKLLHISAAGVWCTYCRQEMEAVAPLKNELDTRKVAWLVSLAEGSTPGTPSTKSDLEEWMGTYKAPFTHVLDSGNKNLGPFYNAAALPWNANISARTMEILTAGTGAATTAKAILDDVDHALAQAVDTSAGLK